MVEVADRRGALALVADLADAGASVETLILDLLSPAQLEVGLRWERRQWTVAQEHAATAIADAALALVTLDEIEPRGGHVLVGCVEGEWHILAARMAAEVLRARGWEVTFLGPSVPALDLAAYASTTRPDAVALSCSVSILLPGARRCIRACREEGFPVLAGGAGFASDGRYAAALGADAWVNDPVAGANRLDRWLDAPPPPGPTWPEGLDEEELRELEASHADLAATALQRLESDTSGRVDVRTAVEAVDLALTAVESATLVGDPALLSAAAPLIERAMPRSDGASVALASILEALLPALHRRSPRSAAVVEQALPAVARRR